MIKASREGAWSDQFPQPLKFETILITL